MVKVITYGTYDLLHYGHIRLLERAKALGDYLIVGVTADDFDKTRGKINVQQSLMERVEAVRATGIADEIIIEEYEGQKIDDIKRFGIDIFTVGSDWVGKFNYLNEYCKVVYLDRTEGVSSSEIRSTERGVCLGLVGEYRYIKKLIRESAYVNGVHVAGVLSDDPHEDITTFDSYSELLDAVDAVYIVTAPAQHFTQIKEALTHGKHVLCETPLSLKPEESSELFQIAKENNVVLMEGLKTAYCTAYYRLLLLLKSGIIGEIMSVDATCTAIRSEEYSSIDSREKTWNSITAWGPTAMLPVFQILGTDYLGKTITSRLAENSSDFDIFTKIEFLYDNAVASIKVGKGVKSEGELIVSGTKGYIYVPAPWWKTDYFEVRYEDADENRRYFYALEGEGIRYEIVAFVKAIQSGKKTSNIDESVTQAITAVINDYYAGIDVRYLHRK